MAFLSGYNRRQKITIDADTYITGDLTNQAVVVHVPSGNTDFWANDDGDGTYVRFTASDGETLLDFEVESFDASGEDAWWHVEVPTLSSSADTDIYIYYKAATTSDGSNKHGTWDANYEAVYHLNQDKPEGSMDDSTSNNHDASSFGTIDGVGQIDKGRDFDGIDDYINIPDSAAWAFADDFTFEITVEPDDVSAGRSIWSQTVDSTNRLYIYNSGGQVLLLIRSTATGIISFYRTTNVVLANNTKSHVVVRRVAAGATTIWIDSVSVALDELTADSGAAVPNFATSMQLGITNNPGFEAYFNGTMDEGTISPIARSDDWIKARHRSSLGAWMSFGAEEIGAVVNVPKLMMMGVG